MKKYLLLVVTFVMAYVGAGLPPISIVIGFANNKVAGYIPVPVFEMVLGLIYIGIMKKFDKLDFGFAKKNFKDFFIYSVPLIATILANVVTSISFPTFGKLPGGPNSSRSNSFACRWFSCWLF